MLLLAYKLFLGKKNYEKILKHRFNTILIFKVLKPANIIVYNLLKMLNSQQKIYYSLRSAFIKSRDVSIRGIHRIKIEHVHLLKIYINV